MKKFVLYLFLLVVGLPCLAFLCGMMAIFVAGQLVQNM